MTAPLLPAELIQQIARNLKFEELSRCRQVSRTWYASIPGSDRTLYEKLFHRSQTPLSGEPFLFIHILVRDYPQRRQDGLSRTAFALSIETIAHADTHGGRSWHPIASNIGRYLDVITGVNRRKMLTFSTLDELGLKTGGLRERWSGTDGGWRDMLVCVPSTKKVRLAVRWKLPHQICEGALQPVDAHLVNEDGVRMSQVVDVIREQLERAPGEMSIQYPVLPLYDFSDWDRIRGW